MNLKTLLPIVLVLTLVSGGELTAQQPAVPDKYRDLYETLASKLADTSRAFDRLSTSASAPTFGVELTAANGNRGPVLLEPRARGSVRVNLDAFKEIGVSGVTIASMYPMFCKGFAHAEEYLDFYKFCVTEARQRGFKVHFKVGEAFHDPVHGHLPVAEFYKELTAERFMREKRQMIEITLRELQPDYLTVANEPDTSAMNTGLDFSPDNFIRYVRAFTKDLPRGTTKVGAGAGTWSPLTYWQNLAPEPSVDYLDMHIYPINREYLTERPLEVAALAKKHHKFLIIGEGWLYKSRDGELGKGGTGYVTLYARDIFAFWEPLDAEFIRALAKFSRGEDVEYMSLFWVNLLYGNVDYAPALDAKSAGELQQLAVRAAVPNIVARKPSPTGAAYRQVIRGR